MTSSEGPRPTVVIEAWQRDSYVVLDWSVYRSAAQQAMKRRKQHRRVLIRMDDRLSEAQLTVLVGRMTAYVLSSMRGHQYVPRHTSWREVGATEWSVPPGGGEGGANRKGEAGLTEGTI